MANPGQRKDALPAFHFEVTINGDPYPFRSVSGLSSETKFQEIEEGGRNGHTHKLPMGTTFPPLQLRQGFCNPASPLYALYRKFIASDGSAKNRFEGSIKQIGPNGTAAKWVFKNAWITKWTGPELDAQKNEVSIEAIEIVHDGIFLVSAGSSASGSSAGSGSGATTVAGGPSASSTPATPPSTSVDPSGGTNTSVTDTDGGTSTNYDA